MRCRVQRCHDALCIGTRQPHVPTVRRRAPEFRERRPAAALVGPVPPGPLPRVLPDRVWHLAPPLVVAHHSLGTQEEDVRRHLRVQEGTPAAETQAPGGRLVQVGPRGCPHHTEGTLPGLRVVTGTCTGLAATRLKWSLSKEYTALGGNLTRPDRPPHPAMPASMGATSKVADRSTCRIPSRSRDLGLGP